MKFCIFTWWEKWLKPIMYCLILALTAVLLISYFCIKDENGSVAFVASIVYALVLFIVTVPLNKIDRYTADKLYEREAYYLALKRLREVINSSISKISMDNMEEFERHVNWFQILTGRDDASCQKRLEGNKIPIYAREKGFIYTDKMKTLESSFLEACTKKDAKELKKTGKKLKRLYDKSCASLEKNYVRIMSTYGGALQELVERDNAASDTDYSLSDINSKIDDISTEVSNLICEIDKMSTSARDAKSELDEIIGNLLEKIDAIELMVTYIADGSN